MQNQHHESSDLCSGIIDLLKKKLDDENFIERHKLSEVAFTRTRKLPFKTTVLFILNILNSSLQHELDEFFKILNSKELPEQEITKSGFCLARKKLNYTVFVELIRECVDYFYEHSDYLRWNDFRLIAIDGTRITIPKNPETIAYFGEQKSSENGESYIIATGSQAYDVLNDITIDSILSPLSVGEQPLAVEHCSFLKENDLVLLDRGYPAHYLFAKILSMKADFCARMPLSGWKITDDFLESGEKEQVVELSASYKSKRKCGELSLSTAPIKVRLILIELETGEKEVLITSLIDTEKYGYEIFIKLYHQRWGVEESYKKLKHRLEIENFSGKSVLSIEQDFYAKVFMLNLTSFFIFSSRIEVEKKTEKLKRNYKINWAQAIGKIKNNFLYLFIKEKVEYYVEKIKNLILGNLCPIRSGRSSPRKGRSKKKFYYCYKSNI